MGGAGEEGAEAGWSGWNVHRDGAGEERGDRKRRGEGKIAAEKASEDIFSGLDWQDHDENELDDSNCLTAKEYSSDCQRPDSPRSCEKIRPYLRYNTKNWSSRF